MDRELVLGVLVPLTVGSSSVAMGFWESAPAICSSGRRMELAQWRQLWTPLLPAGVAFGMLAGWASVEPDDSETLPLIMALAAVPFVLVWLRAIVRAFHSAWPDSRGIRFGTVGLVRPSVIVEPALAAHLDDQALHAALAHEQAHARHRDPLRIWCAQLATDLQWPSRAAARRLSAWRETLEIARDEEAREYGADGADLAAAIVDVARHTGMTARSVASLTGTESALKRRVTHLLTPLDAMRAKPGDNRRLLVGLGLGFAAAVVVGAVFGETMMHALVTSR